MTVQTGLPHWLQVAPKSAARWIVVKIDWTATELQPPPQFNYKFIHAILTVQSPLAPASSYSYEDRMWREAVVMKAVPQHLPEELRETTISPVLQKGNQTRDSPNTKKEFSLLKLPTRCNCVVQFIVH